MSNNNEDVFLSHSALAAIVVESSSSPIAFEHLIRIPFDEWPLAVVHMMYEWYTNNDPLLREFLSTPPNALITAPYKNGQSISIGVYSDPSLSMMVSQLSDATEVSKGQWKVVVSPSNLNQIEKLVKTYPFLVSHKAKKIVPFEYAPPLNPTIEPLVESNSNKKIESVRIKESDVGSVKPTVSEQAKVEHDPVQLSRAPQEIAPTTQTRSFTLIDGKPTLLGCNDSQTSILLKRYLGVRWNGSGHTVPPSQMFPIAMFAQKHNIPIDEEILAKVLAPLNFDGTLTNLASLDLSQLSCITEKKADQFKSAGISNIYDLLTHTPRRYIDRTNTTPIPTLREGMVAAVIGEVKKIDVRRQHRLVTLMVADGTGGVIQAKFFNALWQANRFNVGDIVSVYGTVSLWNNQPSVVGPIIDIVEEGESAAGIVPIYAQSGKNNVSTWDIRRATEEAIHRIPNIYETVPKTIRTKRKLGNRFDAIKTLHYPKTLSDIEESRKTLAYDELFRIQAGLLLEKAAADHQRGTQHTIVDGFLVTELLSSLPFTFTDAQTAAAAEIREDMKSPNPMHRLLQGEVGSGKTLLAITTLLTALDNGYQAVLMAPTEILARQLFEELVSRTETITKENGDPVTIDYFTNKLRGKKRVAALAALKNGDTMIAVGTHALLAEDVEFHNLGVAVIDEQHRFGVEQRATLRAKSGHESATPDLLVMTATPIPRTAAMTVFGDLSITTLKQLPPGRTPITTSWINEAPNLENSNETPWREIRAQAALGRQTFVVCPLVTDSPKIEAASAEETYQNLMSGALEGLKVGLVHGQQKPDERSQTMDAFRRGELDVLVATTVIEVGVNVPNATTMVILDSVRFGISQLHQLRGRVGRGVYPGACYLVGFTENPTTQSRMEALVNEESGFELAAIDLALRGPGSIFGIEQSGLSDLRIADFVADTDLLLCAREDVTQLMESDPHMNSHPVLIAELNTLIASETREWLGKS